jgi:hypothetical protein
MKEGKKEYGTKNYYRRERTVMKRKVPSEGRINTREGTERQGRKGQHEGTERTGRTEMKKERREAYNKNEGRSQI